ncbi:DUF4926 domain-containing protein [Bacillus sonorensis]|uniref:DUF4926 domain-containing protein n=1 Tax=Bacillus sonorensis TaxID=119858 RepID=A0ABM6LJG2_9BACI|nr:DUF4926 domain-containing protein [Bacillus sonorensis]ASB89493.1 hypothetical protein S101395_02986 [Bacillus sonorensis]
MKFEQYETVVLIEDDPTEDLKKGEVGTVVMIFTEPEEAYEVEFVDEEGKTKVQKAFLPEKLKNTCKVLKENVEYLSPRRRTCGH